VTVAGVPSRVEAAYSFTALTAPPEIVRVVPLVGPAAGGTRVTLLGDAFSDSAVVEWVGRDVNGTLTGEKAECAWRGVEGMGCNNTVIQCESPPLSGAAASFDVQVRTSRASSVFAAASTSLPSRWVYEAPAVIGIVPSDGLQPRPAPGANVTILGRNFGAQPGRVTAGLRTLACPVWTDGSIVCGQPPGVASAVNVTVTIANGLATPHAPNHT
jgi:hypothetical protein